MKINLFEPHGSLAQKSEFSSEIRGNHIKTYLPILAMNIHP